MASDWQPVRLGDVLELKRGYDLPKSHRRNGDVPVVSSSGISGFHAESKVAPPGVVTGRYGTIGQVFYVDVPFWPLNTALYVRDFKGNDPRFIAYFLRTIDFASCLDKAAVPGVNRNHLHQLPVRIPHPDEQKRIAEALGALDDKINLNHRLSGTLDRTAQAVFKSWFVDFDPVEAKAEGRDVGLPADLAAMFPCCLVPSAFGRVPDGWCIERMGEHVEAERGLSYSGKGLVGAGEGVPMHNLNSVREGGGYKYDGIKWYSGDYRQRHLVRAGDLIVANTEQGFDHLLIGCPALVPAAFGETGLFSHHLYRVQPKQTSPLSKLYLYFMLRDPHFHAVLAGYTNGTTVNMLPSDAFEHPLIVVPPAELVSVFSGAVRPLLERVEALRGEARTLAGLRDTLLPRLLSGELRTAAADSALD